MFRAEQQIGVGGALVLKRAVYNKDQNFDGIFIQYPKDFVEFEGIGNCSGPFCDASVSSQGIRLKTRQPKAVLLYWGVMCDGWGYPITTMNHYEAVLAFCMYRLYSPKVFTGQGNMNLNLEYKIDWEDKRDAARGNDAFPTVEEFTQIGRITYQNRRELIMFPTPGFDYCDDRINESCIPELDINEPTPPPMRVYFWQLSNMEHDLSNVVSEYETDPTTFLSNKPFQLLSVFQQGHIVNYTEIGRICFAIRETENMNWEIRDALNNDITDLFNLQYFPDTKTVIFVSKSVYSYSSMYFKFKEL